MPLRKHESAAWFIAAVYPDREIPEVVAPMMTSTAIFAAVGIISACYLVGPWQLLPAAAVLFALVGFGFRTFVDPYAWNIFLQVSAPIVLTACVGTVMAFLALRHRY